MHEVVGLEVNNAWVVKKLNMQVSSHRHLTLEHPLGSAYLLSTAEVSDLYFTTSAITVTLMTTKWGSMYIFLSFTSYAHFNCVSLWVFLQISHSYVKFIVLVTEIISSLFLTRIDPAKKFHSFLILSSIPRCSQSSFRYIYNA